jgi:hypothetical protein
LPVSVEGPPPRCRLWRVEIELDDEDHGYSFGERLRALDLDDEARKRLGRRVIVSRDGSRLFLYTSSEEEANAAAAVVKELVDADDLTAEIRVTRWHPDEEEWKDASVPLPRTEAERELERQRREERERREAEAEHHYDWEVHVRLPDGDRAAELEEHLRARGLPVHRRWRYVTIDAATEEEANELASELQREVGDAEVEVGDCQFLCVWGCGGQLISS